LDSKLDLRPQSTAITVDLDIPWGDLQQVKAEMSLRGRQFNDFQTIGSITSPVTGVIYASAGADLVDPSMRSAYAILRGNKLLPAEANDLKVKVTTESEANGDKYNAELQLAKNKE
ncbi:hypothetical protein EGW08_007327, partial [Elysia chlorotica]